MRYIVYLLLCEVICGLYLYIRVVLVMHGDPSFHASPNHVEHNYIHTTVTHEISQQSQ